MAINVTGPGNRGGITLDQSSTTVRQSPRTDFGTQVRNGVAAGAGAANAKAIASPRASERERFGSEGIRGAAQVTRERYPTIRPQGRNNK